MKTTITKIYRSMTDKNKKPLVTRDGRPYERVSIHVKEYGTQWLSGFGNRENANWKEGDGVEIEVEKKGEYLNFRTLNQIDLLERRVAELETKRAGIFPIAGLLQKEPAKTQKQPDDDIPLISDEELNGEEIDIKDIPF